MSLSPHGRYPADAIGRRSFVLEKGGEAGQLRPREISILKIAEQVPDEIPSEKESSDLLRKILGDARLDRIPSETRPLVLLELMNQIPNKKQSLALLRMLKRLEGEGLRFPPAGQ